MLVSRYFAICFTMSLPRVVNSLQSPLRDSRTQVACIGETVEIYCHNCSEREGDWRFLPLDGDIETDVVDDGDICGQWKGRSEYLQESNTTFILRISNVQSNDTGWYHCVKNSDGSSRSSVFLDVLHCCRTPANCSCTSDACRQEPLAIFVTMVCVLTGAVVVLAVLLCRSCKRRAQNRGHRHQIQEKVSERRKSEEICPKTDTTESTELIEISAEQHTPVASSVSSNSSTSETIDAMFLEFLAETCRGERVRSVCVVDGRLYVARFKQTNIEVYDALTMEHVDKLMVAGDGHAVPTSLAADESEKVLYIAYRDEKMIRKQNVSDKSKYDSKWPVDGKPESISVTADHTIVVTFRRTTKLTEYQSDGTMIREIFLDIIDVVQPRSAISIIRNHFVVCYGKLGKTRCGVCVVSSDGTVIPRVDTKSTCPCHLSLGPDRTVFVCDYNDGNVVMLDKNFQYVDTVLDSSSCVNQPFTSCLDASRKNIYIGEVSEVPGDSRVLSFNVCHRTQQ